MPESAVPDTADTPPGLPGILASCQLYSGSLRVSGQRISLALSAGQGGQTGPELRQALRRGLFAAWCRHRQRLAGGRPACLYFALPHDPQVLEVQAVFLSPESFRLLVFPPGQGLTSQFRYQARRIRLAGEQRIRQVLTRGLTTDQVFALHYQPLVKIDRLGQVVAIKGAEAFLRIRDQGSLQLPGPYLQVAEQDHYFMRQVGFKILELACADLKWFKARCPLFTVSLNISEQQFARFDDAISFERIFGILKEQYGIERHDIALEVPQASVDSNADGAATASTCLMPARPSSWTIFPWGP